VDENNQHDSTGECAGGGEMLLCIDLLDEISMDESTTPQTPSTNGISTGVASTSAIGDTGFGIGSTVAVHTTMEQYETVDMSLDTTTEQFETVDMSVSTTFPSTSSERAATDRPSNTVQALTTSAGIGIDRPTTGVGASTTTETGALDDGVATPTPNSKLHSTTSSAPAVDRNPTDDDGGTDNTEGSVGVGTDDSAVHDHLAQNNEGKTGTHVLGKGKKGKKGASRVDYFAKNSLEQVNGIWCIRNAHDITSSPTIFTGKSLAFFSKPEHVMYSKVAIGGIALLATLAIVLVIQRLKRDRCCKRSKDTSNYLHKPYMFPKQAGAVAVAASADARHRTRKAGGMAGKHDTQDALFTPNHRVHEEQNELENRYSPEMNREPMSPLTFAEDDGDGNCSRKSSRSSGVADTKK
jgi:hypothetical protein